MQAQWQVTAEVAEQMVASATNELKRTLELAAQKKIEKEARGQCAKLREEMIDEDS
jgi:NADH dehydrogenase FAD-containing subunit